MKWGKEPSVIVKPRPVLVNIPTEVVKPVVIPTEGEVTEFYIYPKDRIANVDDQQAFKINQLIRLSGEARYTGDNHGRGYTSFEINDDYWSFYSTGKETVRMKPDKTPMFAINDETGEYRFWPKFFEVLAESKHVLVRISAPQKWHDERVRVDPTISIEWEAEFK